MEQSNYPPGFSQQDMIEKGIEEEILEDTTSGERD